jgi:uncharacterized DUF497 family protein
MAKHRDTSADFNFKFNSRKERDNFNIHAIKKQTSVQELIREALLLIYPKLIHDNDKDRKKDISETAN